MSEYVGNFKTTATVYVDFDSFSGAGSSATFTGTTVSVYKDGSAMTTPGGITLTKDVATGRHRLKIDLTQDVNYTTGHEYEIAMDGLTIDGQTVNLLVGQFSIGNRATGTTPKRRLLLVMGMGR